MEKNVLELETRRNLYEIIKNNPGLHLREISRQSGLLPSLVEYHIRYLVKYDLVYSAKEQNYLRFYCSKSPANNGYSIPLNNRQKKILHLLRKNVALKIVYLILRKNSVKHKDILDEIDKSGSTLSYYLDKMVKADILKHTRTGEEKGYCLKDRDELIKTLIMGGVRPPSLVDGFISTWEDFY